jgi:chemotaxis protein methyltransferase WspC
VLLNHDFVSLQQPMAFAFRLKTEADRRPSPIAAPPPRPRPIVAAAPKTTATMVTARPVREPRPEPPRPIARESTIDEAYRLADQGHFAEAATACEDHLRREGPSARAFYLLGLVRDASGNAADAESMYRKALYLDPEHREALLHLALLMDRDGRQADARVLKNRVRRLAASRETYKT